LIANNMLILVGVKLDHFLYVQEIETVPLALRSIKKVLKWSQLVYVVRPWTSRTVVKRWLC